MSELTVVGLKIKPGETVVKARCGLCHEGGAGGAPKIGNRVDWEPRAARGKLALYETALKGKPNTAMMPRGGFRLARGKAVAEGFCGMWRRRAATSRGTPRRAFPTTLRHPSPTLLCKVVYCVDQVER